MYVAELPSTIKESDSGFLDIYFGHSPDFVEALRQKGESFLALAGHTHGGQVQILGLDLP